jgi:hypothetical protein
MVNGYFRELVQAPNARREALLRAAKAPSNQSLIGYEWRGYNASALIRLLGLQKFIKGFFQGPALVEGYNIPVEQNGLQASWLAKPDAENPRRFGFYTVSKVDPGSRDHWYPEAALLDYGASQRNAAGQVERALRDYLVQPDPANPDVLLGKAYIALGSLRLASNFFILERLRAVSWKP